MIPSPPEHDFDRLVRRFSLGVEEFLSSPLYTRLSPAIAGDRELLAIAAACRVGQQPRNLFLAAVHYLLLGGVEHELAAYYASLHPTPRPPDGVEPVFRSFCLEHRDALVKLVSTGLVQTNAVKRSAALRLGLAVIAQRWDGPVDLLELGCSAGIHLRFDSYRYELAGRVYGDPDSSVVIDSDWRGPPSLPDLDRIPPIANRLGVDLHPINPADADQRRWLHALVWPENRHEAELLDRALEAVAADPPPVIAGDAIDLCPKLGQVTFSARPLVVFHAATRLHISQPRRSEFDAAVAALAGDRPLYWLSLEGPLREEPRLAPLAPMHVLGLRQIDETGRGPEHLALVDAHAHWIQPLDL
jgi:hypothetical protein